MYRWPLMLLRDRDLASDEVAVWDRCVVEISPRAAAFTLTVLGGRGDPTALVAIDRDLKRNGGSELAVDALQRLEPIAAVLLSPLILAHELAWDRFDLTNVVPLPLAGTCTGVERGFHFVGEGLSVWTVAMPNILAGLNGPQVPTARIHESWAEIAVELRCRRGNRPLRSSTENSAICATTFVGHEGGDLRGAHQSLRRGDRPPAFWKPTCGVATALRSISLAIHSRAPALLERALDSLRTLVVPATASLPPEQSDRLRALFAGAVIESVQVGARPTIDCLQAFAEVRRQLMASGGHGYYEPPDLPVLARDRVRVEAESPGDDDRIDAGIVDELRELDAGRSIVNPLHHDGLSIDVALAPEVDGGATLALLPPVEEPPIPNLVERMEAAARAVLVGLMGMQFTEERKEDIEHRLVGPERTTTLLVGWSLVLPRNRRVFAAWLGSDGRVMIRLFPPEGQRARGRL